MKIHRSKIRWGGVCKGKEAAGEECGVVKISGRYGILLAGDLVIYR